jgi:hypothetical protein
MNEVVVIGEQGDVDEYVQHCVSLLKVSHFFSHVTLLAERPLSQDDTVLLITLRSLAPSCVSKMVQVAEATKRRQYKDDDQELHQYVGMSFDEDAGKGKDINLDDNPTAPRETAYQPPNTHSIHLSKIPMPELEPKTNNSKNSKPGANSSGRRSRAEPEASKTSKVSKQERRQSSATMASLAPPSPGRRRNISPYRYNSNNRGFFLQLPHHLPTSVGYVSH